MLPAPLHLLDDLAAGAGAGLRDGLRGRNRRAVVEALRDQGRGGAVRTAVMPDGARLHVEVDEGDPGAVALVHVHGFSLDLTNWRAQRPALADLASRRVFYDQRCFGRSKDVPAAAPSMRLLAADLAEVVAQVAPGQRVVLVGHSMGVMVVAALAGLRPDLFGPVVAGTVLVAGNANDLHRTDYGLGALAPYAHAHAPELMQALGRVPGVERATGFPTYVAIARTFMCHETAPHEVLRACAAMVSQNRLAVLGAWARAMYAHDERAALPVLGRVPCTVVAAAQDRFIPEEATSLLAREVPGAELVVVERSGHMVPLEHPDAVERAVRDVLARASRA